jgi:hypothetical protein
MSGIMAQTPQATRPRPPQLRRRQSNGEHVNRLAWLAMNSKPSMDFSGNWQRHDLKEAAN